MRGLPHPWDNLGIPTNRQSSAKLLASEAFLTSVNPVMFVADKFHCAESIVVEEPSKSLANYGFIG